MKHGVLFALGSLPPPLCGELNEPVGVVWDGLHSWTVLPTQVSDYVFTHCLIFLDFLGGEGQFKVMTS